ncbi:MAG: hypothetical protein IJ515_04500 [Clostridia bacterium]|nr:hypothetical protein [Clostridia bacterium]
MSKIISFLLSLTLVFGSGAALISCSSDPDDSTVNEGQNPTPTPDAPEAETIITPAFKDYGRRTVDFEDITYTRPDVDALIAAISAVTDVISENTLPFDGQVAAIEAIEPSYEHYLSMYSYSNIIMSRDSSDEYWCGEYNFISSSAPSVSKAVEDMYVAAAQSPHAESFESEYFGEGLIEEYADGGDMTERLVELFEEETELENRYSSLSTASVKVTYNLKTDTVDNILAFYEEFYGKESQSYSMAYEKCMELYALESAKISRELFVELVRLRRLIADELSLTSYSDYAYGAIYHDYSSADMLAYLKDIAQYVIPVYVQLSNHVFAPHNYSYESTVEVSAVDIVNGLYYTFDSMDSELVEVYSYMLQHVLYDIAPYGANRFEGSFCTYIDAYDAPYVFISSTAETDDYCTLAHEFGHFADAYVNYDSSTSLDLSEVSSLGLEYMTTLFLNGELSLEEQKHLTYSQLDSAFMTFIYQGFYALFEHYAYGLDYDEITEENLIAEMKRAARDMGLNYEIFTTLDYVLIPHIMLYPHYVQSYCTSTAVALELYYVEKLEDGAGIAAYLELIDRSDEQLTFEETVVKAGLTSPFEKNYLRGLADMIYYDILGSHFYTDTSFGNAA